LGTESTVKRDAAAAREVLAEKDIKDVRIIVHTGTSEMIIITNIELDSNTIGRLAYKMGSGPEINAGPIDRKPKKSDHFYLPEIPARGELNSSI